MHIDNNLMMSTDFNINLGDPKSNHSSWIQMRISNCGSIQLRIWDNKTHDVIEKHIHATELAALLYKNRNIDWNDIYKSVIKSIELNHE